MLYFVAPMKKRVITRIVILGSLLVLSMLAFQFYWVYQNWSIENHRFKQTVTQALFKVTSAVADHEKISLPDHNLIRAVSNTYFVVNINNVIDAGVLERFLIQEFQARDINLDFEYAIYDCSNDDMVYGDFCNITSKDFKPNFDQMPKYEEFTYYFGVNFPNRSNSIFVNLRPSLLFSAITLLSLLFFVATIIVLLQQKKLWELQTDFINNLTHEFKTPLSSIRLANEFLQQTDPIKSDSKLQRYTNIIQEQNQRLNRQVERILDLAKWEKEDFVINPQPVDLHALIREVIDQYALQINNKNGKIDLSLQATLPVIRADEDHLLNLLSNLVDNGIKYSSAGAHLTFSTTDTNRGLRLVIQDQGIGIHAEDLPKLFTKFYRVHTGNVHNVKGFGLGLYYVKKVCDAHGWKVEVASEPGRGTSFTINIV